MIKHAGHRFALRPVCPFPGVLADANRLGQSGHWFCPAVTDNCQARVD